MSKLTGLPVIFREIAILFLVCVKNASVEFYPQIIVIGP